MNNHSQTPENIPDSIIESLAAHLLPRIREFYESEEGQAFFRKWKESQGVSDTHNSEN